VAQVACHIAIWCSCRKYAHVSLMCLQLCPGEECSGVVLHEAELVFFRIAHDDDYSLVIVMPLARPATTEPLDLDASRVNIVYLNVEVDADLSGLRLRHLLEGEPGLVIVARANRSPSIIVAMLSGDRHVEQCTPESR
jgi:hypothetical protein